MVQQVLNRVVVEQSIFVTDEDTRGRNVSLQFTPLLHDCSTASPFSLTPHHETLPYQHLWQVAHWFVCCQSQLVALIALPG